MTAPLETAQHPERLQRVVIEPLTRVEGHGKVTLLRDDQGHIRQARLHIAEFRGFEKFIQGRPYWELPVVVQRLCGICPVSHHLAAAKATDMLVGVDRLTPSAEKIRRLMHFGQTLQSHALHFFHLCAPDLLFGFDDRVRHRNIVGLIEDEPEIARQGVLLRRFGQEVIRATAGKRVHGTGALPGGVNQHLSPEDRDALLAEADQTVAWAEAAVGWSGAFSASTRTTIGNSAASTAICSAWWARTGPSNSTRAGCAPAPRMAATCSIRSSAGTMTGTCARRSSPGAI